MNRGTIAMIGAAGLLLAFFAATVVYEGREASQIEAQRTGYQGPPFLRDGAPTLGSQGARVVLVEFFDPG